ncbi:putative aberrant root formation protein 4-like isoform X2 [Capsicum annuum]|nr:putative aberrant root formation protein 4-like isoform X2 [Capsicum annuum]KAF3648899.1 putative aberrant root formation protein 4-like isoform X2 [Capsicum annuum]
MIGFLPYSLVSVVILIKRRQFEQVKAAVPVILGVLKSVSLEAYEEGTDTEDLFLNAFALADSIQAVCKKLDQKDKKKLSALLGLFVLQVMVSVPETQFKILLELCWFFFEPIMTFSGNSTPMLRVIKLHSCMQGLVSIAMGHNVSSLLPIVLHLSQFLPICGLSYEGLITGHDVDKFTTICGDDGDDSMAYFSHVKPGGSLAVIWGYKSNETSVAANADFEAVKNELQKNQTKRWQAIGMLKHVFSSVDLSWELKAHALDFLLCIMDGCVQQEIQSDNIDHSTYMPILYTTLQAIEMVIIYAPDAVLRKKSFDALVKDTWTNLTRGYDLSGGAWRLVGGRFTALMVSHFLGNAKNCERFDVSLEKSEIRLRRRRAWNMVSMALMILYTIPIPTHILTAEIQANQSPSRTFYLLTFSFSSAEEAQSQYLNITLMLFEAMPKLHINMSKNIAYPDNVVSNLQELAEIMFCNIGSFRATYLCLPVGASPKAIEIWNVILKKIEKRLASWQ